MERERNWQKVTKLKWRARYVHCKSVKKLTNGNSALTDSLVFFTDFISILTNLSLIWCMCVWCQRWRSCMVYQHALTHKNCHIPVHFVMYTISVYVHKTWNFFRSKFDNIALRTMHPVMFKKWQQQFIYRVWSWEKVLLTANN